MMRSPSNGNWMIPWIRMGRGSNERLQRFEDATEVSTVWATLGPHCQSECAWMDLCITERLSIDVTERPVELPSISDFSPGNGPHGPFAPGVTPLWSSLSLPSSGARLVPVRAPTEERRMQEPSADYDIEATPDYGGVKGMDHHVPPPAPKLVSKDERRSDDSGYVRPLRRR